jgi:DNA phosphorothioation-associated putative methyltransferase
MDYKSYKALVKAISIGKQLPDAVYVHESALEYAPNDIGQLALRVGRALEIENDRWNIVKFYKRDFKITLLNYPTFDDDSYPALSTSFTIDLQKLSVRKANYGKSDNPPILHRKETFVDFSYPLHDHFQALTKEGEAIGLYDNVRSIGFRKNWLRLIAQKGYFLDGDGRLSPSVDRDDVKETNDISANTSIDRHKTAIDRHQLSQPMKVIAGHNYLNGEWSVLDYGCGKGDDLRELEAHGIDASGWDPVHNPEGALINSDIVNLGFVLNVIEERNERDETLRRAWSYADKLLVVSVMVAGESIISQFQPFKDGIITSRNTFQRYYSQGEFRYYVESTLKENAIAAGPGIFLVFKDKLEEQRFLAGRHSIKRDWRQKTRRQLKEQSRPQVTKDVIEKNIDLFADFWNACLELGRIPANSEFEFSDQIRRVIGSHNKAYHALEAQYGTELMEQAEEKRKQDLQVYFALGLFEKRKPYIQMPNGLKRDIKAFYGSYSVALDEASEALFSVGDPTVIQEACEQAFSALKSGEMNEGHSYIFHKDYLGDVPPLLRIYVGCATQLYGDLGDIQLIKAHIRSGKVSLMGYDDWNKDAPCLTERIKIKMREQDVDFFDYTDKFVPPPLHNKLQFTVSCNNRHNK